MMKLQIYLSSSSSLRRKFHRYHHLHEENLTDIYFRLIGKGKTIYFRIWKSNRIIQLPFLFISLKINYPFFHVTSADA